VDELMLVCVGYKGVHYCEAGSSPQPSSNFCAWNSNGAHKTPDPPFQKFCKICGYESIKEARRNGVGRVNGHFYWNTHKKIARKLSKKDGVLNIDKISKDERLRYLKLAREGYNSIIDPPKEDLPKIHKDPKTKSISVPRETYPKEGYVYIFQDMMKPEGVYKIGSTDDVGSRLSNARTWGEFQCVRWFYSDDCKVLERNTHHELSEFKIKKDHMGDEWFQIAEDAAIHKIQELSNASTAV